MGSYGDSNGHMNGHTNGHVNGNLDGHTDLPKKDSPHVFLEVATEDEIKALTDANCPEWRGALKLEAYCRREHHLANQELTKDGGLTTWVLVYQPDRNGKREVLSGCETIKKKALVSKDGKVDDAIAHGVGSVFCPPEKRGKGYAGRMMTDLGKRLKSWQLDDRKQSLFSVLYSDIGKEFYAARGWQAFPSTHVSLPPRPSKSGTSPAVRLLGTEGLEHYCALDEKITRHRMSKMQDTSRHAVALVPDYHTLRWHHAREEFVAKELFNRNPSVKGAVVGEEGSRVWCYWTRVWTDPEDEDTNTLHILRLAIEDEAYSDFAPASLEGASKMQDSTTARAIGTLFATAQAEAAQWGMEEVQIWNPTSTTLAAAQRLDPNVVVEDREKESITSLRWYGEGSWENVDWLCNEKYGWN